MLMTRNRVELAIVRPGNVTKNGIDASIRIDEGRINLLETIATKKAKGRYQVINDGISKSLEIKQLLVDMTVIGETIVKDKWESGCLIRELGANQCRVGCVTCMLDAKLKHLEKIVPDIKSGYGELQIQK